MGVRRWRNAIYRETMFKPHYRSVYFGTQIGGTGTNIGFGVPQVIFPELGDTTTDGFWMANGGVIPIDRNVSIPDFIADITLRGGKIGCQVQVSDGVVATIACNVFLIFIQQGKRSPLDFAGLTASQPYGWDPMAEPDFATGCGKVLKKWSAVMNYNNPGLIIEHKLRPRKIDAAWYLQDSTSPASTVSNQFAFIVHVVALDSSTNQQFRVGRTHNLSFSGDADTVVT